jgi:hypothetical protein
MRKRARRTQLSRKHIEMFRRGDNSCTPPSPNETPPGPGRNHAGLISRPCFLWVNPLIQLASQRSLKLSDLWPLDASAGAAVLVARFERAWAVQLLKPAGKRSFSAALGSMFWPTLIATGQSHRVH